MISSHDLLVVGQNELAVLEAEAGLVVPTVRKPFTLFWGDFK